MMRRLRCLMSLCALLCIAACQLMTDEQRATATACEYYAHLSRGDVSAFVDGKAGIDTLPTDYREQFTMAVEAFVAAANRRHGGLQCVLPSTNAAVSDTAQHTLCTFVILQFADSTQEEIAVPMVKHSDEWKMR